MDQGSFRGAAFALGLAPSRVSEVVSQLEGDLGVTLLYRTTRQISLTTEGRLLHQKAQDMLAAAETGLDAISPLSTEPAGSLKVSCPAFITQTGLMEAFAAFVRAYPSVDISIHFSDRRSDLIRDGYDVAIRAGWPEDSDMMTRNIGKSDRFLVASPDYCASHPEPKHPDDLESWDWVQFELRPDDTELTSASGERKKVKGRSSVKVNSAEALYEFAVQGLGVTAIPENLACRGFERGELVHVLPTWSLRSLQLFAIWPNQSRRENLTTFFVRFLAGETAT